MRESMTLLEQANFFNKSNRQRLLVDQTVRHAPLYSSLNNIDDDRVELKTLSFDVYSSKHLVTTGKSILSYSDRNRFDKLLLPSIDTDTNRTENRCRRQKKRPSYRKSLYHQDASNTTKIDLAQLSTRGMRPKLETTIPIIKDDDTLFNFQRHHAPPPSPSDDEIERLLYELQDKNQSRPLSRQSPMEKDGYIPFRLPALHRSARLRRCTPTNQTSKDIRSTLSNYLQKYY